MKLSVQEYSELLRQQDFQNNYVGHFKNIWSTDYKSRMEYDTTVKKHSDIFAKGPLIIPVEDPRIFETAFFNANVPDDEDYLLVVQKNEFFDTEILLKEAPIFENDSYFIR